MNTNGKNITHPFRHLVPTWCRTFKTDIRGAEPSPNTPRRVLRGDLFLPEGPAAQYGPIYGVEEAFGMPKEGLMPSGPGLNHPD